VTSVGVAVVGAGPAGLCISHELTELGIEHVVLERGRVAQTWRDRWENFCLVTPNWSMLLPGFAYDGPDPDGFMPRDEIVAHFERYAESFDAPVREGVEVRSIRALDDGFELSTSSGDLRAGAVVIASGAFQRPHRPEVAATLPPGLLQIDVEGYRSEEALPAGRVLIVGSGQSGCQIAEELHERAARCSGLREGALGSSSNRRPRLCLVGAGNRLPRRRRRVPADARSPARGERPDDGSRRRPRPAPANTSAIRCHADRALPGCDRP
jgi:cation diffusion facilitator CzcD-associated flavoprotein CzcO